MATQTTDRTTEHERILRDEGFGPYLTTQQVRQALACDRTTVYRLKDEGKLTATRIERALRFSRRDVARYLAMGEG